MRNFVRRVIEKFTTDDPIPASVTVVSGLPRSGTSLMMTMLEAGGILPVTDHLRTPDQDNPNGYYEFERVKQLSQGDVAWVQEAEGKAVKVISALLRFLPPHHAYRVLFMERAMPEVLASQRKMIVHRQSQANDDEERIANLFQQHLLEARGWLASQPNFATLYISYNDLLADPRPILEEINTFLGGGLDVDAMQAAINPDLYRNRDGDG